jgi:hypothetical protein
MENKTCCIECFELVEYNDAIYENDDAKDDRMLCIECFCKKKGLLD